MTDHRSTLIDTALQHGPRPLPLFLAMLRSETAASPERYAAAMAGLRAFQEAPREPAPEPMPARHRAGRTCLRDYGGEGRPVVFVPSLINPPAILDLGDRSLLRWLAARGHHVWMVDWGTPGEADRDLDLAGHVERLLLPLIESVDEPPVLVGYCLGGTLATAAAACTPIAGLATLASPWRFAGYGDARTPMLEFWRAAQPACAALGVMPMEMLQACFWHLDPARTIGKYEAFGRLPPDSPATRAFVRLEDWANAGAPLPYAAARDLFERFVGADASGKGNWIIGGRPIVPSALVSPNVEFVSSADRIVPAATSAGFNDGREVSMGHVGMIVGGRAKTDLWEPLQAWL